MYVKMGRPGAVLEPAPSGSGSDELVVLTRTYAILNMDLFK